MRLTSSRWRRIRDGACKTLSLRDRATDEALQAVAELKALTVLHLGACSRLTDQGVQAVAELKALTELNLGGCLLVTNRGVQAVA